MIFLLCTCTIYQVRLCNRNTKEGGTNYDFPFTTNGSEKGLYQVVFTGKYLYTQ